MRYHFCGKWVIFHKFSNFHSISIFLLSFSPQLFVYLPAFFDFIVVIFVMQHEQSFIATFSVVIADISLKETRRYISVSANSNAPPKNPPIRTLIKNNLKIEFHSTMRDKLCKFLFHSFLDVMLFFLFYCFYNLSILVIFYYSVWIEIPFSLTVTDKKMNVCLFVCVCLFWKM